MTEATDFLAICKPGMTLRTRGRSEARIINVDAAAGLVHGEIPMYGPAAWRTNGVYKDSPGGAAGPFDLMPPNPAMAVAVAVAVAPKQSVKLSEALDSEGRAFCCD